MHHINCCYPRFGSKIGGQNGGSVTRRRWPRPRGGRATCWRATWASRAARGRRTRMSSVPPPARESSSSRTCWLRAPAWTCELAVETEGQWTRCVLWMWCVGISADVRAGDMSQGTLGPRGRGLTNADWSLFIKAESQRWLCSAPLPVCSGLSVIQRSEDFLAKMFLQRKHAGSKSRGRFWKFNQIWSPPSPCGGHLCSPPLIVLLGSRDQGFISAWPGRWMNWNG